MNDDLAIEIAAQIRKGRFLWTKPGSIRVSIGRSFLGNGYVIAVVTPEGGQLFSNYLDASGAAEAFVLFVGTKAAMDSYDTLLEVTRGL